MLEVKKSAGGTRVIPQWAEARLARRLEESEGFKSYGEVQGWLEQTLGVEADYHAVYQMTRYQSLKQQLQELIGITVKCQLHRPVHCINFLLNWATRLKLQSVG